MRRNERLVGAHFSIGIEDAVFLRGELPLGAVTAEELDRAIGTLYATVEQVFRGLLRIGFASRFPSSVNRAELGGLRSLVGNLTPTSSQRPKSWRRPI